MSTPRCVSNQPPICQQFPILISIFNLIFCSIPHRIHTFFLCTQGQFGSYGMFLYMSSLANHFLLLLPSSSSTEIYSIPSICHMLCDLFNPPFQLLKGTAFFSLFAFSKKMDPFTLRIIFFSFYCYFVFFFCIFFVACSYCLWLRKGSNCCRALGLTKQNRCISDAQAADTLIHSRTHTHTHTDTHTEQNKPCETRFCTPTRMRRSSLPTQRDRAAC